jgi:CRP-like cAMP-binding protein
MLEFNSKAALLSPTTGIRRLSGGSVTNCILQDAPEQEFEALRPHLEFQDLPSMRVLNEPGQPVANVYFLNSGFASLEIPTSEGASVEVGTVGKDGFIGISLLCGVRKTLLKSVIHIRGTGYRIKGEIFERILQVAPQLRLRMKRYALLQGMQVAQIAACNRVHGLEKRLARWLLDATDRVGLEIPITQEELAQMLGTGRASLSVVASRIRKSGIIQCVRGTIMILNRSALEDLACECYGTIRGFQPELGSI